jgi:SAM-dependent methyltransferase
MGNNINIQLDNFEGGQQRSHLWRYYLARGFIEPTDIVVDSACGYGYGTKLLSQVAKKVIGIDKDAEAVKYASEHYKQDNNYFMAANLDQIETYPLCDVVVCVETFEHLRYPESFAGKIMQSARKKIFLTCPIVPTKHEDPTHLNDFTESQVMEIFNNDKWGCIDSSLQGVYLMTAFYKK